MKKSITFMFVSMMSLITLLGKDYTLKYTINGITRSW